MIPENVQMLRRTRRQHDISFTLIPVQVVQMGFALPRTRYSAFKNSPHRPLQFLLASSKVVDSQSRVSGMEKLSLLKDLRLVVRRHLVNRIVKLHGRNTMNA